MNDLDLARRHVVEGEARCTRQRLLITELETGGRDTTEAEALLASFEEGLAQIYEHLRILQVQDQRR